MDDALLAKVDELTGARGRSVFVRRAVERAVEHEQRWSELASAAGAIEDSGHAWDGDPAEWVRGQRRADERRAG